MTVCAIHMEVAVTQRRFAGFRAFSVSVCRLASQSPPLLRGEKREGYTSLGKT